MKNTRGFTLVELLIVIVVVAILAAISVVAYNGIQERARDAQRSADISNITKALEVYYLENGEYPAITGGSTTINGSWATTADGSWRKLADALEPYAGKIGEDPVSTASQNVTWSSTDGYNYAYFSNSNGIYCETAKNQTYILVYRFETQPPQQNLIGDCPSNPLGPYVIDKNSNYRVSK